MKNQLSHTTRPMMMAAEVAHELGVSLRTVWRWAKDRTIPAPIRIRRVTRWRRQDIEAFIEAKAQEAAKPPASIPPPSRDNELCVDPDTISESEARDFGESWPEDLF